MRTVEQEVNDMFSFAPEDIARLTAQPDEDKLVVQLEALKKGLKGY